MIPPPVLNIKIKPSDRNILFHAIARGSYAGTKAALKFLINNFVVVKLRFQSVLDIFDNIAACIISEELLQLVRL